MEPDHHVVVDVGVRQQQLRVVVGLELELRVDELVELVWFVVKLWIVLGWWHVRGDVECDRGLHRWHDGERERSQLHRGLLDAG